MNMRVPLGGGVVLIGKRNWTTNLSEEVEGMS